VLAVKFDILAEPSMPHHVTHAHALTLGLERHGIKARTVAPWDASDTETVACWGWRIAAPLVAAGKRVLVMEHGYIGDRKTWTSLGWNGLNGRAQFAPARDTDRFWKYHGDLMRPWNPAGDYTLLIGQVDGDSSLGGMPFQPWAVRMAHRAEKEFGLPVKFRPHPVAIEFGQNYPAGCAETLRGTLADAMSGAAVVVTFNSNAAVESVLAGKPTITMDAGSVAWPVSAHGWTISAEPDRATWAADLAWRQFTIEEIRNGSAWEHIRNG
jgi:hypothetical protein